MFRLMLCALLWLGLAMLAAGAGGKSYSPTDLKNPMLGPKVWNDPQSAIRTI
jgi:hypothetical protein